MSLFDNIIKMKEAKEYVLIYSDDKDIYLASNMNKKRATAMLMSVTDAIKCKRVKDND